MSPEKEPKRPGPVEAPGCAGFSQFTLSRPASPTGLPGPWLGDGILAATPLGLVGPETANCLASKGRFCAARSCPSGGFYGRRPLIGPKGTIAKRLLLSDVCSKEIRSLKAEQPEGWLHGCSHRAKGQDGPRPGRSWDFVFREPATGGCCTGIGVFGYFLRDKK